MKILSGATVFTGGSLKKVDLGIESGIITEIGKDLEGDRIDCKEKLILPGAIDIHVHFRDPGQNHKEDWFTGSRAAAKGGVTTIFDMVNNDPPTTTYERLMEKKELAKKSIVNYGLYFGLGESNLDQLDKIAPLVCGFKLYMCKTTGDLLLTDPSLQKKSFKKVKKTGKIIVVHAEDQETLDKASGLAKGRTDFLSHADSRPRTAESKAVAYAISCAKYSGAKTHLTHISTQTALTLIREAKSKGLDLTCDTTPTYLNFTRDNLKKMGSYCKTNPPVRTKEDKESLWESVKYGLIDIISTDHAPHTLEEKEKDFICAPSGIPSVELMVPLMLDAVNKKKITLETFINACSTNPARRFGLEKRGEIKQGNHADLIVVDMHAKKEVTRKDQVTKCGWSPYEGMTLKGWPEKTFVNGCLVYDSGRFYYNSGKDLFERKKWT